MRTFAPSQGLKRFGRHEYKMPRHGDLSPATVRRVGIDFGVVAFDTWRAPNPRQRRGLPPSAIERFARIGLSIGARSLIF